MVIFFGILSVDESFAEECKAEHVLIFKVSKNTPACVKPSTAEKLMERGWGMMPEEPFSNYSDSCKAKPDPGLCKAYFPKYYFNSNTSSCEQFIWGGCGGVVPFDSLLGCQVQCQPAAISEPDDSIDGKNIVDANNQFTFDFYSQISKEKDENIFYSPWSISTAFAIAYEGAQEQTSKEIQQVFGFPSDYETRTSEFKTAIDNLNPDDVPYQLSVANALWLAEKFNPLQEYIETAITYYDSEVSTVDFISNDGVNKINAWAEEKTNEKIKEVLKPGSTDEYTRLAITNAIYFKGNWVTQFNETNTTQESFWKTPTEDVQVPLMQLKSVSFNHTQTEDMQILKMPYEGDRLSMLVLLSNEKDGLTKLEESLSVENLKQWNEDLSPTKLDVYFPKFKLETDYDLIEPLVNLGMPTPFTNEANFEGIAPIDLSISAAIHKAFVEVNEEGTEAAGVTAIMVGTTSLPPPTPVFKADHPFVFLIQDDSTGNILFMGRVVDP